MLGDAISVQIRGFDYLAIGLVIGFAALSIADVLYLNLRERQPELVTLRTVGWEMRHLVRVVRIEAATPGFAGSAAGASVGAIVALAVLEAPIDAVLVGAGVAIIGAVVVAAAAAAAALLSSLLPLSKIGKLTPPSVLAAEQ